MDGTATSTIRVEQRDAVAIITLHRPDRLNAYTPTMGSELEQALASLDADEGTNAIVVTGEGRAFCAGQDLAGDDPLASAIAETGARRAEVSTIRPFQLSTPVIAAINGHAVGIGLTMTLHWDIRLVARNAKLAFPFVRRGIVPDALSSWFLPRLIGHAAATELLLTGRYFDGTEAAALGVASRALDDADVLDAALDLAHEIAESASPTAVSATRHLVGAAARYDHVEDYEPLERRALTWLAAQHDAGEGAQAFLEKRPPAWRRPDDADGLLTALRAGDADLVPRTND